MLKTNKPQMEQTFSDMLAEESGMLYKAAYAAHYKTSEKTYNIQKDSYNSSNRNSGSMVGGPSDTTISQWEDMAKTFAKTFVNTLKEVGFDKMLADEIDKHVNALEPMINLIIPTHGALASPTGPVTGSIVASVSNGAIKIM